MDIDERSTVESRTIDNVKKLAEEAKEFLELEDVALARGFLRVKILIGTIYPLAVGC